jgi:hypothetical protein
MGLGTVNRRRLLTGIVLAPVVKMLPPIVPAYVAPAVRPLGKIVMVENVWRYVRDTGRWFSVCRRLTFENGMTMERPTESMGFDFVKELAPNFTDVDVLEFSHHSIRRILWSPSFPLTGSRG